MTVIMRENTFVNMLERNRFVIMRLKEDKEMLKKIVLQLQRIILSTIFSIVLLSAVCLVYGYNRTGVPSTIGASSYACEPKSLSSKMNEGFGWNVMDANGYNNDEAYDEVDVLIMGGSHIEAFQLERSENVTYKLDEMLPQYHVYNVGTSGHSMEICVNYLDNACAYFEPKYVAIDLNSLELDAYIMESVMSGIYSYPELRTQRSPLARVVRDNIPVSATFIGQLRNWKNINSTDVTTTYEESLYDDPTYIEILKNFLAYVGNIIKNHDIKLILLYHPMNYDVDGNGNLTFEDETNEWETFQSLCKENNIVAVSTKDEYIRMFHEQHVAPNGFSNTKLGEGHINKYGHTAMANVLYETIENLEE